MKRIAALFAVLGMLLSLAACTAPSTGGETNTPDTGYVEKLEEAVTQTGEYLYGTVKEPVYGSVGGEWTVLGLARSDLEIPQEYFESYFQNISAYTAGLGGVLHQRKYTEYSRVILAVTAIGYDPRDVGGYNLLQPLADFEQTVFQGINGPAFALLALDSGNYEIPENTADSTQATRDLYVDYIIGAQLPDGGWSLTGGSVEIDLTAMVLQALAKYRDRKDVAQAIEKGLAILSARQGDNGGFPFSGEEAENSESVSQVMVALAELGIPLDDPRFVKNGNTLLDALLRFRQADGGFSHQEGGPSDLLATEQAFYALVAASRMERGVSSLYSMK